MSNLSLSDPLFATGHISILLLILGLFLPRFSLFIACFGAYPANPLSPLVNFLGWLFLPRFLWAYYISIAAGTHNVWFWAYIILGVLGLLGEGHVVHRRVVRRVYNRNGNLVETVEE